MTADDFTTFGGRLTALHQRIADPETKAPYSRQYIATQVGLSIPYVSQLFTGSRTNPSKDVQERLATCLGLSSALVLQDPTLAAEAAKELDVLFLVQNRRLQTLMTRISKWSDDRMLLLESMLDALDQRKL